MIAFKIKSEGALYAPSGKSPAGERGVMQPPTVMTDLVDALTKYVSVLAASAEHTTRAEDRTAYTRHLAEAARMFAALHAGDEQALRERVVAERRTYGWSFLNGEAGEAAEAAFAAFARMLDSRTHAA